MKCDLGDIAIFYETYGTGRPIVMLPGRPSDHRVMTVPWTLSRRRSKSAFGSRASESSRLRDRGEL